MVSIKFYCRECKSDKGGYAPIEISVNIDGKRLIKTLPCPKETPRNFERLFNSKGTNELKLYCEEWRLKVNKIIYNGGGLNEITGLFVKQEEKKIYTISLITNEYYQQALRKNITVKSANVYKNRGDIMVSFFGDINIEKINKGMIDDFLIYLGERYEQSTVSSIWRKCKSIFEYAYNHQRISHNPFNGYKISRGEKDVEYLTVEEVERIQNKTFATERLNRVRDIFIFACNTAISFCDLNNITKENIEVIDGVVMYVNKRNKTNVTFYTPLNKVALSILERYDYKLPIRSNQNYNAYLKEIGDICGIDKKMHSHIARHTAATMMLNNGIPIEIVSKVLGHTNITQTQHYAKLTANRVAQAFQ